MSYEKIPIIFTALLSVTGDKTVIRLVDQTKKTEIMRECNMIEKWRRNERLPIINLPV